MPFSRNDGAIRGRRDVLRFTLLRSWSVVVAEGWSRGAWVCQTWSVGGSGLSSKAFRLRGVKYLLVISAPGQVSTLLKCTRALALIRHMRSPIGAIRRDGSWGYLAGSLREATLHLIIILMNIREKETKMLR